MKTENQRGVIENSKLGVGVFTETEDSVDDIIRYPQSIIFRNIYPMFRNIFKILGGFS